MNWTDDDEKELQECIRKYPINCPDCDRYLFDTAIMDFRKVCVCGWSAKENP